MSLRPSGVTTKDGPERSLPRFKLEIADCPKLRKLLAEVKLLRSLNNTPLRSQRSIINTSTHLLCSVFSNHLPAAFTLERQKGIRT